MVDDGWAMIDSVGIAFCSVHFFKRFMVNGRRLTVIVYNLSNQSSE